MVRIIESSDEDTVYLKEWALRLNSIALEINSNALKKDLRIYFSITSTLHSITSKPYMTPLRILESGVIFGVVVFSPSQAIIAGNIVRDMVDEILVDAEKKNLSQVRINYELLDKFNINLSSIQKKSLTKVNNLDISSAARLIFSNNKITEFKPNDITVDAVWTFLSIKLNQFYGKQIAIIGCGNIGFKLALKLAESGAKVLIVRRNKTKGNFMAEAINLMTPYAESTAEYLDSAVDASKNCDVLIGAATQITKVISSEMIQNLSPNGFVIDIGKGNLEDSAIKIAIRNNIDIFRGDITGSLYGFISHVQKIKNIIKFKTGRSKIDSSIAIISGGLLGKEGEIVVDNYSSPSVIYGVSNGLGSIKTELNDLDKANIKKLRTMYDFF